MNRRSLTALLVAVVGCDGAEHITFSDAGLSDLGADVPPSPAGAPCATNAQGEPIGGCSRGQFCITPREGFPNGYCAPDCRAAPCAEGSVCYPASATRHYCLRECSTDADCRASEGYVCRAWRPGARPACVPNEEPVGRRDGRACYATEGDAGAGPFLAPLPAVTFAAPAVSVSRDRFGTQAEVEVSLALDPSEHGGAVVAFMGIDGQSHWRGGVARLSPEGAVGAIGTLHDFDFPDVLQPSVAFGRGGALHAVYVANNLDIPGNALRHATSADGGATFERARSVLNGAACGLGCSAPAVAVGPDIGGTGDAVYAASITGQRDGSTALVVARMAVGGTAFDMPSRLAELEVTTTARRAPGIVALSAGPEPGHVSAAWVARNLDNALAALGDPVNRVRLRTSRDGGRTWEPAVEAGREGDAPVGQVPWVASGGSVTHVVYVTGGLQGVWDVVLATRRDGEARWSHRVVNDDPDRCATHGFAGLTVDPTTGDAHVLWLDNRYGGGVVAYARCPADTSQRCRRNELVSGEPFAFTTSSDPLRGHGTRSALVLAPDGALWAAWSDVRSGGPGVYVARGRP